MLYRLISTYELLLTVGGAERPARIEVFQSQDGSKYRARIWIQNTYNLYPTLMNTNNSGDDLHTMHSSDEINQEITSIILEDPGLVTGKEFNGEDQLISYIETRLKSFAQSLQ